MQGVHFVGLVTVVRALNRGVGAGWGQNRHDQFDRRKPRDRLLLRHYWFAKGQWLMRQTHACHRRGAGAGQIVRMTGKVLNMVRGRRPVGGGQKWTE